MHVTSLAVEGLCIAEHKPELRGMAVQGKQQSQTSLLWAQVRLNFPNSDMVGHTGDLRATLKACTAVDEAVTVLQRRRPTG